MPVERVYEEYKGNPTRVVAVAWGRDSTVQVATAPVPAEGSAGVEIDTGGEFVTLNRIQINDLIRTLRRARDQAYGRDE